MNPKRENGAFWEIIESTSRAICNFRIGMKFTSQTFYKISLTILIGFLELIAFGPGLLTETFALSVWNIQPKLHLFWTCKSILVVLPECLLGHCPAQSPVFSSPKSRSKVHWFQKAILVKDHQLPWNYTFSDIKDTSDEARNRPSGVRGTIGKT